MTDNRASTKGRPKEHNLSIYHTWCKRCGNCVAFCPRGALAADEWGYPFLQDPQRCIGCGLCAMLCPDFALSMIAEDEACAEPLLPAKRSEASVPAQVSPERLAPAASGEA